MIDSAEGVATKGSGEGFVGRLSLDLVLNWLELCDIVMFKDA